MNPYKYKNIIVAFVLLLGVLIPDTMLWGQSNDRTHIDFIPRYRKKNPNIVLTRIDYYANKMVMHLMYIADSKDSVRFYGKQHPNAWIAQSGGSATRPSASNTAIQKTAEVCNIRINDKIKASWLPANQEIVYAPEKGDIVSCELHIEKMPHFIKVINVSGGDSKLLAAAESLLNDVMLKTVDSDALGSIEQMKTVVANHYKEFDYIRYPNLQFISSIDNEQLTKEDEEVVATPIKESMNPVTYMPKMLTNIEDLKCKERIILRNVYFEDNSAEFSKRTIALKTVNIVYDYLKNEPDSKIVLHGHTDIFGNPYDNLVLSKERVLAIKRILTQKGIDKHRIITLYHGGEQPLPNCEKGHELNRRVEVELVCEDKVVKTSN